MRRKANCHVNHTRSLRNKIVHTSPLPSVISFTCKQSMLFVFSYPELFSMEIKNFDKTRGKFLLKIKYDIFPFKTKLIPWVPWFKTLARHWELSSLLRGDWPWNSGHQHSIFSCIGDLGCNFGLWGGVMIQQILTVNQMTMKLVTILCPVLLQTLDLENSEAKGKRRIFFY